jgi:ABC-2 type transport system permease protein
MRFLAVINYKFKEMTRDVGDLMVPIIFPVVFMIAFGVGFKGKGGPMGLPFFDFLTPGMVVFALLMLSIGVSGSLARETDQGTLTRIKLSTMSSFDLLFGFLVMWALVGVVQVLLLFGTGIALGFEWQGGLKSLALAAGIASISGIASVALGLIMASFARTEGQASAFTTLITVPMAFLVGSFMPMNTELISQFLPWGQAGHCMRALLNAGAPISLILPNILWMSLETVILFAIGVLLYSRLRLRPE